MNIYPFEKFDSIESENYWKYCKFSLICYKPFRDHENHLLDYKDPTPTNWINAWVEFRESKKDTIYYDLYMHIKKETNNE